MRRSRIVAGVVGALLVGACSMLPQGQEGPGLTAGDVQARPGPQRERAKLPGNTSLAIVWDRKKDQDFLAHVHPRTFDVRRRVLLGAQGMGPRALSPDGTRVAFGTRRGGVRIYSVRTLRRIASFNVGGGWTSEVMWPANDRILLFTATAGMASAMTINTESGEVLKDDLLPGTPLRTKKTRTGFVSLMARPGESSREPGTPVIVHVTHSEPVRFAQLDRIKAGYYWPEGEGIGEHLDPALAVRDGIATVVGTTGEIAHVDLATMNVGYVTEETTLMERLTAWLLPPALAKLSDGTSLWADWYGDTLVVSGYRHEMEVTEKEGPTGSVDIEENNNGLGVMFVDPDTGETRVVNEAADRFALSGGRLFAYSTGFVTGGRRGGIGLVAYRPDGEQLWHSFGDSAISQVSIGRGAVYVTHGWSRVLRSVVDLETGKTLNTRQTFVRVLHL